MTVAAGQAARDMQSTEMNLSNPKNTFASTTYSVAQGGMIDVSFQGMPAPECSGLAALHHVTCPQTRLSLQV